MYKLKDGKKQSKKADEDQCSVKFCCVTSTILKLRSTLATISSPQSCFINSPTTEIRARPTGIQSENQCAEMNVFTILSLSVWGKTCVMNGQQQDIKELLNSSLKQAMPRTHPKKIRLSMQDDIIANQL